MSIGIGVGSDGRLIILSTTNNNVLGTATNNNVLVTTNNNNVSPSTLPDLGININGILDSDKISVSTNDTTQFVNEDAGITTNLVTTNAGIDPTGNLTKSSDLLNINGTTTSLLGEVVNADADITTTVTGVDPTGLLIDNGELFNIQGTPTSVLGDVANITGDTNTTITGVDPTGNLTNESGMVIIKGAKSSPLIDVTPPVRLSTRTIVGVNNNGNLTNVTPLVTKIGTVRTGDEIGAGGVFSTNPNVNGVGEYPNLIPFTNLGETIDVVQSLDSNEFLGQFGEDFKARDVVRGVGRDSNGNVAPQPTVPTEPSDIVSKEATPDLRHMTVVAPSETHGIVTDNTLNIPNIRLVSSTNSYGEQISGHTMGFYDINGNAIPNVTNDEINAYLTPNNVNNITTLANPHDTLTDRITGAARDLAVGVIDGFGEAVTRKAVSSIRKTISSMFPNMNTHELHDYNHAALLFRANNYEHLPKQSFLYHVYFDINPIVVQVDAGTQAKLGMLVKQVTLPRISADTKTVNAYNAVRVVQTKLRFEPVTITFHDDSADLVRNFWNGYMAHYWSEVNGSPGAGGYSAPKERYLNNIHIYSLHHQKFSVVTLVHPIIKNFSGGEHNSSSGGEMMSQSMTIEYESVKYNDPKITTVYGYESNLQGYVGLAQDLTKYIFNKVASATGIPLPGTPTSGGTNILNNLVSGVTSTVTNVATDAVLEGVGSAILSGASAVASSNTDNTDIFDGNALTTLTTKYNIMPSASTLALDTGMTVEQAQAILDESENGSFLDEITTTTTEDNMSTAFASYSLDDNEEFVEIENSVGTTTTTEPNGNATTITLSSINAEIDEINKVAIYEKKDQFRYTTSVFGTASA